MRPPSIRRSICPAVLALAIIAGAAIFASAAPAKQRTVIECANKAGTVYKPKSSPSECVRFGPGGSFGGGVYLTMIKWDGWGSKSASFTATECGFHLPCAEIPVTGRAYGRVKRCGHRAYTRLAVTSSFGTTEVKLSPCAGRVPLP